MLDVETKGRINTARDILVGKVPDPKSQVEQITIALIYKFMDDMDVESEELGGKRTFFVGEYAKYAWRKIFDPRQSGYELLNLYSEAIGKMDTNPGVPKLFRDIFKNAYLPYRDPETLKSFLKIINEFDYSHSEKLGDAFEYLLSVLGSQGDAGQFRTPRHIIDFMVEIVDPKKDETILDPACGTAGFLISSYKHIIRQNSSNYNPDEQNGVFSSGDQSVADRIISTNGYAGDKLTADDRKLLAKNIHGYDISPDMVRLSLVNMYLHGIKDPKIFEYDTLTSEDNWHHFSDVILANPPFMSPKGGIRPHKRFSVQSNRSEVLFVDYIAEHLTANGRAAVIVPEGIIFQSGKAYKQLRKKLVEECLVGVISLPAGVFNPYAGVKTSILWLDKALAKKTDKILFVKIENDGFDLGAQRRAVKGNDLPNTLQIISKYKSQLMTGVLTEFAEWNKASFVSRNDIAGTGDYNLSGDRFKVKTLITSNFPIVTLIDVCDIQKGSPITKNEAHAGEVPVVAGGQSPAYYHNQFNRDGETITVSASGAYSGFINYFQKPIFASDCFTIAPKTGIQLKPKYLFHILKYKQEDIYKFQIGGGQPHVYPKHLEAFQIPLPPLSVQEEIVAEIESYQKIIDGARQVVENYKPRIDIDPEWDRVKLGDICKISGILERNIDPNLPYIGADSIQSNTGHFLQIKSAEEQGVNGPVYRFSGKNILYSKIRPYLNKVVMADFNGYCSSDMYPIVPNQDVSIDYLFYFLLSDNFNSAILGFYNRASIPKINRNQLFSVEIPLPSLEMQNKIIAQIKNEQEIINANRYLIQIYEQKIKDRIAKVWGE